MELVRVVMTETGKFELWKNGEQYTLRYVAGQIDSVGNFVPSGPTREVALQRPEDDPIIASADDLDAYRAKFGL